jgi:hypothetical protein
VRAIRKTYDDELKKKIKSQIDTVSIVELSIRYGIPRSTLYDWKNEDIAERAFEIKEDIKKLEVEPIREPIVKAFKASNNNDKVNLPNNINPESQESLNELWKQYDHHTREANINTIF